MYLSPGAASRTVRRCFPPRRSPPMMMRSAPCCYLLSGRGLLLPTACSHTLGYHFPPGRNRLLSMETPFSPCLPHGRSGSRHSYHPYYFRTFHNTFLAPALLVFSSTANFIIQIIDLICHSPFFFSDHINCLVDFLDFLIYSIYLLLRFLHLLLHLMELS